MSRRGYNPTDETDFSSSSLEVLVRAGEEVSYLVDRAYPRDSAIAFVGNRYQLSARQRLLLARSVSGEIARRAREAKRLDLCEMAGREVLIDGFNAVITLEVALSGSLVVRCQDGTLRDLAGLKGTYHPLDVTGRAVTLILEALESHGATGATFLLDAPVSNSGRLKQLICEMGEGRRMNVEAETLDLVDREMFGKRDVVSSDSVVLDRCESWYNLDAEISTGLEGVWCVALHDVM